MHVVVKQTLLLATLNLPASSLIAGTDAAPPEIKKPLVGKMQEPSPARDEVVGVVTQVNDGLLFDVTVTDARGGTIQIGDKITLHLDKHTDGRLPASGSSIRFVPNMHEANSALSVLRWSMPPVEIAPAARGITAHQAPVANHAVGIITSIDAGVYSIRVTDSRTKGLAVGDTIKARLEKGRHERLPAANESISFAPKTPDKAKIWSLASWELNE